MKPRRFPAWTLALAALAGLSQWHPALAAAWIFDRAAIDSGQWWRLYTGNLVHLSAWHFACDSLALLALGAAVEWRGLRHVGTLYLAAGLAVGSAVYLWAPQIDYFGGLSGIVTAAFVYLCLAEVFRAGSTRWLWGAGLALAGIKLALEYSLQTSWLIGAANEPYVVVPASHIAGAATALALYALVRRGGQRRFACGRAPA
jgi:rhomboid family GlyGly-CTERM serine protease